MEKFRIFIQLTRLDKPIGFLLLFWPCAWGLILAYYFNNETTILIKHIVYFFLGSAFFYVIILCLLALLILLQFNFLTIILGAGSMILAFAYPFMKRFTYWPQLFLGLTFNWGIIMGWTSLTNNISIEPILLYVAAIFWTLGYDTIYGVQDLQDDQIIGIKSTSIKFKNNIKLFVAVSYSLCILFILALFVFMKIENYLLLLSLAFIITLIYQIKIFNVNKPKTCLSAFKVNNLTGVFIFLFITSFNIS